MAVARAHPNIALVKYWGKRPGPGNIPATPSLSVTLDGLETRTRVAEAAEPLIVLNGKRIADPKIEPLLAAMRAAYGLPPLAVESASNFPAGAGLASSASGFAALVTAIDGAFGLGLDVGERAIWARRGSASAARSVYGGFAALDPDEGASTVLDPDDWPLEVVIAITSDARKAVPSTAGMERSRRTSPFYQAWTASAQADFNAALAAVRGRDFDALAEVAEHSCGKLHALMLSTRPSLVYWNAATINAIHAVRDLRRRGAAVFYTVDAGPQVKAVCLPGAAEVVAARLGEARDVKRVVRVGLGGGARLLDEERL